MSQLFPHWNTRSQKRYLCIHIIGGLAEFGFGEASNAIANLHFLFDWENIGNFTRVQDVVNILDKSAWARGKCADRVITKLRP